MRRTSDSLYAVCLRVRKLLCGEKYIRVYKFIKDLYHKVNTFVVLRGKIKG